MKVRFEHAARDELDRIHAWIAKDNPRAARDMIARIEEKVMRLETPGLADMGRPGLVPGTRELLEWPYLVVYKVAGDEAVIARSFTAHEIERTAVVECSVRVT